MAYVYSHIRKDNGKCFYIGKGTGDRAWSESKRNNYWFNVSKKGYDVKILIDKISDEKALKLEKDFISQIGLENLTNLQQGGIGGWNHITPKIVKKRNKAISKAKKGIITFSEDHKNKLREKRLGTTLSDKTKAKISKAHSGKNNHRYGSSPLYLETSTGYKGYLYDMRERFGVDLIYINKSLTKGPIKRGKHKGLNFKKI